MLRIGSSFSTFCSKLIIFLAIFINEFGAFIEMNDPKIFGALVAVIVGYFSKNIIATISAGLVSYWFLIFVVFS